MTESNTLYCYAHPGRETSLKCKRCERPICPSCAVRTPTGYLCKDCVKTHQKNFITAEWYDYILGFIVAGILSSIAAILVSLIGNIGFFGWFLVAAGSPTAGMIIAEAVRAVTRRHRARSLFITVAVGVAMGALPVMLIQIFRLDLFGIVFQVIYLVIAVPLVYARLSGIQLVR